MGNLDETRQLAIRALEAGAERISPQRVRWNIAPHCDQPYERDLVARNYVDHHERREHYDENGRRRQLCWVELSTPCRECEGCKAARRDLWRLRASQEIANSARTWFGTLTLSPDSHQLMLERARVRERAFGHVDFEQLPASEQFRQRARECLAEVTLWLKRVRKAEGSFRYLCVVEAHASGLPHMHLLLHEADDAPLRHATLKEKWRLGFVHFKLVDASETKAASYVSKYLAKSALARVRASKRYGTAELVPWHLGGRPLSIARICKPKSAA